MKHQGTWGSGAYILQTGQMLEPQVQSSNEIRIRDGALMVQGALGCVKVNTYDPVTIQNGSQGMKRIDLICWQYTYDAEQDVEAAEWVVIQGTPAESDPQQPAYTDGDIQQGDSPVQVPVFAVELDGINVTGVTTLLPIAPTLEELNSNSMTIVEQRLSATDGFIKYSNGLLEQWGRVNVPGGPAGTGTAKVTLEEPYLSDQYNIQATAMYPSAAYPTFEVSAQMTTPNTFNLYTRQSSGSLITGVTVQWATKGTWK